MPHRPPCEPLGLELNEHTGFCIKPCKGNEARVSTPPYNCTQKEKTRLATLAAQRKIKEDDIASRVKNEEAQRKKKEEEALKRAKELKDILDQMKRREEKALRKEKEEEARRQDLLDRQKKRDLEVKLENIQKKIKNAALKIPRYNFEIRRLDDNITNLTELSTQRKNEHESTKAQITSNVESIMSMTLANESSGAELETNNISIRDIVGQINALSEIGIKKKEDMGTENLKLELVMRNKSRLDGERDSLFTLGRNLLEELADCLRERPEEPRPEEHRPEEPRPEEHRPEEPRPEEHRPEEPEPEEPRARNRASGWVCTAPYPKSLSDEINPNNKKIRRRACRLETGGEPFDNVPGLFNGTERISGARFVGRQPCIEECYHER